MLMVPLFVPPPLTASCPLVTVMVPAAVLSTCAAMRAMPAPAVFSRSELLTMRGEPRRWR